MEFCGYAASVHLPIFPIEPSDFETICDLLDRADGEMRTDHYGRALRVIEAGVQIFFDAGSREKYVKAMQSDDDTEKLINRLSFLEDQVDNMER